MICEFEGCLTTEGSKEVQLSKNGSIPLFNKVMRLCPKHEEDLAQLPGLKDLMLFMSKCGIDIAKATGVR